MAAAGETSIKDLVRKTVSDGQRLVKAQLALTQAELSATGEAVARTSVFAFIAFGAVLLFGIFILITIAYVFVAIGLPVWAGFGIVSLILLITALTTGLLARAQAHLNQTAVLPEPDQIFGQRDVERALPFHHPIAVSGIGRRPLGYRLNEVTGQERIQP